MDELERAANKRDKKLKDLDDTILNLVREQYRLMGIVLYEQLDSELDDALNGPKDNSLWN